MGTLTGQTERGALILPGKGAHRENSLQTAAALLNDGKIVAFPTETVYGLGALAMREELIAELFRVKGRPSDNPLIVHVDSPEMMSQVGVTDAPRIRDLLDLLARTFMPGPLTVVLPSRDIVPLIARAGLPTVALRIPANDLALDLIARTGPLVAPSANRSGRPSPTRAEHVLDDLGDRIAAVLDGGACQVGIESTVLDLTRDVPTILRPGSVTFEQLSPVVEGLQRAPSIATAGELMNQEEVPSAPGMKYRHYAPSIPVELVSGGVLERGDLTKAVETAVAKGDVMVIVSQSLYSPDRGLERLSEADLYEQFRRGEKEGYHRIVIVALDEELSEGLENRIRKAVQRS